MFCPTQFCFHTIAGNIPRAVSVISALNERLGHHVELEIFAEREGGFANERMKYSGHMNWCLAAFAC